MFKHIGRVALAALVTLALGLGLTLVAGSAGAASGSTGATSASSCSSERAQVVKAQKKVKKDKKKLKKAKKHHNKAAVKKAKKKLKRDRKALHRAQAAYRACLNRQGSPSPAPAPTPAPNPVTEQCLTMAGQLTSQDPTGTFAGGAEAFCDLLGELAASTGGDPTALCDQLAAQDPTGQFGQLCDALGGAGLPSLPSEPGLPDADGGLIGSTLEEVCNQIAAQDPTGQLQPLCTGLGSLPV